MKFSAVALFAGMASAAIVERQVQTLIGVVNDVNQQTGQLDTAVKAFNGASDIPTLQAASDKLASTVTKGVETVNSASTITLTDAVQIQGQVQNLQASVEGVVTDLTSKKQALIAAGAGGQVSDNLQAQLKGAQALSAAIASKVPPEVSGLAQQLSAGIVSALQKGVDAFKDAPKGSASGSGSTGSSASAGSSGSTGSSASTGSTGSSGSTGSTGSTASTGSSGSSSGSSSGAAPAKPATPSGTGAPAKPATYTGAASRTVAGSLAGVAAILAFLL